MHKGITLLSTGMGVLATSCLTTGAQEAKVSQATGSKKPNVVYILADDLGYGDLGCYGQKKLKTPNIDRLATEGMKFTNHYFGNTVCSPITRK